MANTDNPNTTPEKVDKTGTNAAPAERTTGISFTDAVEPPKNTGALGYLKGGVNAVGHLATGLYEAVTTKATAESLREGQTALFNPISTIQQAKDNVVTAWNSGDTEKRGEIIGTGLILGLGGAAGARGMVARSSGGLIDAATVSAEARTLRMTEMLSSARTGGMDVTGGLKTRIDFADLAKKPEISPLARPEPIAEPGIGLSPENLPRGTDNKALLQPAAAPPAEHNLLNIVQERPNHVEPRPNHVEPQANQVDVPSIQLHGSDLPANRLSPQPGQTGQPIIHIDAKPSVVPELNPFSADARIQAPHSIAIDTPVVQAPHSIAIDTPVVQAPHSIAIDTPVVQDPHTIAKNATVVQETHPLTIDAPVVQKPQPLTGPAVVVPEPSPINGSAAVRESRPNVLPEAVPSRAADLPPSRLSGGELRPVQTDLSHHPAVLRSEQASLTESTALKKNVGTLTERLSTDNPLAATTFSRESQGFQTELERVVSKPTRTVEDMRSLQQSFTTLTDSARTAGASPQALVDLQRSFLQTSTSLRQTIATREALSARELLPSLNTTIDRATAGGAVLDAPAQQSLRGQLAKLAESTEDYLKPYVQDVGNPKAIQPSTARPQSWRPQLAATLSVDELPAATNTELHHLRHRLGTVASMEAQTEAATAQQVFSEKLVGAGISNNANAIKFETLAAKVTQSSTQTEMRTAYSELLRSEQALVKDLAAKNPALAQSLQTDMRSVMETAEKAGLRNSELTSSRAQLNTNFSTQTIAPQVTERGTVAQALENQGQAAGVRRNEQVAAQAVEQRIASNDKYAIRSGGTDLPASMPRPVPPVEAAQLRAALDDLMPRGTVTDLKTARATVDFRQQLDRLGVDKPATPVTPADLKAYRESYDDLVKAARGANLAPEKLAQLQKTFDASIRTIGEHIEAAARVVPEAVEQPALLVARPLPVPEATRLAAAAEDLRPAGTVTDFQQAKLLKTSEAFRAQVKALQALDQPTAQDLLTFTKSHGDLVNAARAAVVPEAQLTELETAYRAASRRISDNIAATAADRELAAGQSLPPNASGAGSRTIGEHIEAPARVGPEALEQRALPVSRPLQAPEATRLAAATEELRPTGTVAQAKLLTETSEAFRAQVKVLQAIEQPTGQNLLEFTNSYKALAKTAAAAAVPEAPMAELEAAYRVASRRIADNIADSAAQRELAAGPSLTQAPARVSPLATGEANTLTVVQRALVDDGWKQEASTARTALDPAKARITAAIDRTDLAFDKTFAESVQSSFARLEDKFKDYERQPSSRNYGLVRDELADLNKTIAKAAELPSPSITTDVRDILNTATDKFRTPFTSMATREAEIEAAFARQAAKRDIEAAVAGPGRRVEPMVGDVPPVTPAPGTQTSQVVRLTSQFDQAAGTLAVVRNDAELAVARSNIFESGERIVGQLAETNPALTDAERRAVGSSVSRAASAEAEVFERQAELSSGQARPRPITGEAAPAAPSVARLAGEPVGFRPAGDRIPAGASVESVSERMPLGNPAESSVARDGLTLQGQRVAQAEERLRNSPSPAEFRDRTEQFRKEAAAYSDAYAERMRAQSAADAARTEAGAAAGPTAAVPASPPPAVAPMKASEVQERVNLAREQYALDRLATAADSKAQLLASLGSESTKIAPLLDSVIYAGTAKEYAAALKAFTKQLETVDPAKLKVVLPEAQSFISASRDAMVGRRLSAISDSRFPSLQEALFNNPGLDTWLLRRLPAATATLAGAAGVVDSVANWKIAPTNQAQNVGDGAVLRSAAVQPGVEPAATVKAPIVREAVRAGDQLQAEPVAAEARRAAEARAAEETRVAAGAAAHGTDGQFVQSAYQPGPAAASVDQSVFSRALQPAANSSFSFLDDNKRFHGGMPFPFKIQVGNPVPQVVEPQAIPRPVALQYSTGVAGSPQFIRVTNTPASVRAAANPLNRTDLDRRNYLASQDLSGTSGSHFGGPGATTRSNPDPLSFVRQQAAAEVTEQKMDTNPSTAPTTTYATQSGLVVTANNDPQAQNGTTLSPDEQKESDALSLTKV